MQSPKFELRLLVGIRTTTSMKIPTSKKLLSPETDEKYDYFEFCPLTQCNFCVFGTAMADLQVVAISADFFQIQPVVCI